MSIFALFKIDVKIVVRFQCLYLGKRKKNVLTLEGNLLEHITRLCAGSSGRRGGGRFENGTHQVSRFTLENTA